MKRSGKTILAIEIVLFLTVVTSCDYLLPLPLGRDNVNDDARQIVSFTVLVSGETAIITTWTWLLPSSGLEDSRKIDRIRIIHSENDPPSTWNPVNQKDVVEISAADEWQHEWTELKQDRNHFFALYAHEKGGVWLAPVIKSRNLDYNLTPTSVILNSDDNTAPDDPEEFKAWYLNKAAGTVSDFSTNHNWSWNITDNIIIVRFKDYESVFFDKFMFALRNASPGSDVTLTIYPLYKNAEDVVDWTDLTSASTMDYGDKQTFILKSGSAANQVFDISSIMNRLIPLGTRSIALTIDNPLIVSIDEWTMDTLYWEN